MTVPQHLRHRARPPSPSHCGVYDAHRPAEGACALGKGEGFAGGGVGVAELADTEFPPAAAPIDMDCKLAVLLLDMYLLGGPLRLGKLAHVQGLAAVVPGRPGGLLPKRLIYTLAS